MKKIIFIALITLTSTISFAQNFSELANTEFKSKDSFKSAESQVLTCANYLFSTPADQAELNRLNPDSAGLQSAPTNERKQQPS